MAIEKYCSVTKNQVRLSDYTSVKIGGIARTVSYPTSCEIVGLIKYLEYDNIPYFVLGKGSNTLISDNGYGGVVVLTSKLTDIETDGDTITCGSGVTLPTLAKIAKEYCLSGLEWAVNIPGSVGGGIVTNAGAFGVTLSDIVESATIVKDTTKVYDNADLGFGYRKSNIPSLGTVTQVRLKLKKESPQTILTLEREYIKRRQNSQPKGYSLGSVFRAHNGVSAGYYIEQAGLKGVKIGGAEISPIHANFIINTGSATARDYLALINLIEETVYSTFGIRLVKEINIVGEI